MAVSEKLKKAVESGNVKEVRDWLCCALMTLDAGETYEESLDYCKKNNVTGIYDKHDGKNVDLPVSNDNAAQLMGELRVNFSEERVKARLKMMKELYGKSQSVSKNIHEISDTSETFSKEIGEMASKETGHYSKDSGKFFSESTGKTFSVRRPSSTGRPKKKTVKCSAAIGAGIGLCLGGYVGCKIGGTIGAFLGGAVGGLFGYGIGKGTKGNGRK